ncbi:hypothetical protein AB0C84_46220 [Actinomadura sp. NPDC048955]|uniref:hypothetical protein n=1 Tax=Actinomadura sp. NPDC048955 TaxID=3158228 RepID=UPI0033D63149
MPNQSGAEFDLNYTVNVTASQAGLKPAVKKDLEARLGKKVASFDMVDHSNEDGSYTCTRAVNVVLG